MLLVPTLLWDRIFRAFASHAKQGEQVAFLDGVRAGDLSIATTVTLPRAQLHRYYYTVPAEAMTEAGQHLFELGLERVAQVHTHPGLLLDHSPRDDAMTYSHLPGAISIVLPHGGARRVGLELTGVHVCTSAGWVRVDSSDAQPVRLVESTIDLR